MSTVADWLSDSNGEAREVRTYVQDDQVRYDLDPLELQLVPLRPALVHLRVRQVQDQDLPAMHSKGIGSWYIAEPSLLQPLTCCSIFSGPPSCSMYHIVRASCDYCAALSERGVRTGSGRRSVRRCSAMCLVSSCGAQRRNARKGTAIIFVYLLVM